MTDIDISSQQAAIDEFQSGPDDRPVLRARFEHNGSPRYMLYTIKRFGYDHDHGFHLDLQLVSDELEAGRETVEAKLQDGDADLIDIDYISTTARERADGAPIVAFHPYGQTVGGQSSPTIRRSTGSRISRATESASSDASTRTGSLSGRPVESSTASIRTRRRRRSRPVRRSNSLGCSRRARSTRSSSSGRLSRRSSRPDPTARCCR